MNQTSTTSLRNPKGQQIGIDSYGKLPPQARDLEQAILGAIMLEKNAFDQVCDMLHPACFYVDAHQRIYQACLNLKAARMPIDMLTVVEALKASDDLEMIGGVFAITQLTNNVTSSAHIEGHAKIILQKFMQRELIRISGETIMAAYEDSTDVHDLLDTVESAIFAVSSGFSGTEYLSMAVATPPVINKIESLEHTTDDVTGVHTGFFELDKITHGWQPTDLIIIAARPSVGKTAYALNLARSAAASRIKPTAVGFFSLEMGNEQLVKRLLSNDSEIAMTRLQTGKGIEKTVMYKSADRLSAMPIFIDDTAALSIGQLRNKARRMVSRDKVGLIIVDYLQLMTGDKNRQSVREQEISSISRGLKQLAKQLKVPVIALSQLSRKIEDRKSGEKVPQLSDLRESGAIEQDADMVMFLYRPDEQARKDDAEMANVAMAKIAKHRNGELASFKYLVDDSIQRWTENGLLDWNAAKFKQMAQNNDSDLAMPF